MLLTDLDSREISKSLDIPELAVELERAIWQVSTSLEAQKQKVGVNKHHDVETSSGCCARTVEHLDRLWTGEVY